jgi:hypothetical protein
MAVSHFQIGNNAVALNNVTLRGNDDGTFSICSGIPGSEIERLKIHGAGSLALKRTQVKFLSGSGTYTRPANCIRIRVRMVGGGGSGGGYYAGTSGGNTTFGTNLLRANGGGAGQGQGNPTDGGTATIAAPAFGIAVLGSGAQPGARLGTQPYGYPAGGAGGNSPFGGGSGGALSVASNSLLAPVPNSGSGGGGASTPAQTSVAASGGSAGGYIDAFINSPAATYAYAVGAGGVANQTGAGGLYLGMDGASGMIVIDEFYA